MWRWRRYPEQVREAIAMLCDCLVEFNSLNIASDDLRSVSTLRRLIVYADLLPLCVLLIVLSGIGLLSTYP